MYVLGCLNEGVDDETYEQVVDRIVDRLSRDGRVGVVRYDATIADGAQALATIGGDVTYGLGADGDWTASGTGMTVRDALDALAPDCEYAVVTGVPELRFPVVAVGSTPTDDRADVLATVDRAGELDEDGSSRR